MSQTVVTRNSSLLDRFVAIRRFTGELAEPLSSEDCALQSMPDVSPTKWHLAHTTWFFETFILAHQPGYVAFDDCYAYLFNSYYNSLGKQYPRPHRGLLSRPSLSEVLEYRDYVDSALKQLILAEEAIDPKIAALVEVGLQHEQQHQELILTDIKHVLSCNPLRPTYRKGSFTDLLEPLVDWKSGEWHSFDEGICWAGSEGDEFCFDNELPRHREFVESFQIAPTLVTCGEYLQFIQDGGYERPELWLSLGWQTVSDQHWTAPLYWYQEDGQWKEFTLAGPQSLREHVPVTHVSYYEADAFARWAGARLPREVEWELAAEEPTEQANFVDRCWNQGVAIHPGAGSNSKAREKLGDGRLDANDFYGDVWQWTSSPYTAYPGYRPPDGALGEYNGKFMCNQFVLRGGSCATSSTHIRRSYRNFFPPEARWQFSGIRLCQ